MSRKLLAILISCLAACSLAAAEPPAKPAAKRAQTPPAARPAAAAPAEDDILPRTVFDVLLGEMALQRGKLDMALGAYVDLAKRTRHPAALARATEIAMHSRQLDLALELARLWADADPDSFKAQQTIVMVLMHQNKVAELGDQIAQMLERDKPRLSENLIYLNRMLARLPDRPAVSRLINKVVTPYRGIAEAHYANGMAALGAGEMALARRESALALELRPDWEMAALLRAQVLAKESPREARELLQEFAERHPKASDVRLNLARLLLTEKKYGEARREFDRVLAEYPASAEALYPAAMLALQQNDAVAGRMLLERLLDSNFGDKSAVHYFLGQIDEDAKQPEAALAHYRQVVAGDQYMAARARISSILIKQGQPEEALAQLRATATKTDQERVQLTLAEASLLRDIKRVVEAFGVLEAALKKHPDNLELLYDSALMADRVGKKEVLESRLQRVLELKPDHAHALNALGYTWADQNRRLDEALKLIQRALVLQPGDAFILDSLGWVYFRLGRFSEALETLQQAFHTRPDPEIAAHLGEVLWTLERRAEARKVWQEALAKHPESEELATVIKRFPNGQP